MLRTLLFVIPFSLPACSAFALISSKNTVLNRPSTSALRYANGNNNDVLPFPLRHLDLNGDGKIDVKDLEIFQRNAVQRLDLNDDGQLDEKDLAKALLLVLVSWALLASPVAAKGGGHGGGGGSGHGGGGGYRSSGGRIYSGRSATSFEPYYRNRYGRNSKYSKPWNPAACYSLPGEGEELKVLTGPYRSYAPAVVTDADEATCTFYVQLLQQSGDKSMDDGSSAYTQSFHTMRNWADGDLLPLYCFSCFVGTFAVLATVFRILAYQEDKAFDKAFTLEQELSCHAIPACGRYVGSTQERDGASQAIKVDLRFSEETREINGSGYDSDDGKYSVEGEWGGSKVKWTEHYLGEGFTVEVRGTLNEDATKFDCRFVSSRGVRGTFVLRKKKPWAVLFK